MRGAKERKKEGKRRRGTFPRIEGDFEEREGREFDCEKGVSRAPPEFEDEERERA